MLPLVCTVTDHRRLQNQVRTSVTSLAAPGVLPFFFSPHFDIICDLLLNRCTAMQNLFVERIIITRANNDYKMSIKSKPWLPISSVLCSAIDHNKSTLPSHIPLVVN